jgi:hypothetical protein
MHIWFIYYYLYRLHELPILAQLEHNFMKPFPKVVSAIFALAAMFAVADRELIVSLVGEAGASIFVSICVIVTTLGHSITGTGGKTPPVV